MKEFLELLDVQEERYYAILRLTLNAYEERGSKSLEEQEAIEAVRRGLFQAANETYQQMRTLLDPLIKKGDFPPEDLPLCLSADLPPCFEDKRANMIELLQKIHAVDQLRVKQFQREIVRTGNEVCDLRKGRDVVSQYQKVERLTPSKVFDPTCR